MSLRGAKGRGNPMNRSRSTHFFLFINNFYLTRFINQLKLTDGQFEEDRIQNTEDRIRYPETTSGCFFCFVKHLVRKAVTLIIDHNSVSLSNYLFYCKLITL